MSFKELFYLRKSDRDVLLVLMVLIVVVMGLLVFVGGNIHKTQLNSAADSASMYRNRRSYGGRYRYSHHPVYYAVDGKKAELFSFDPNTADSTQLLRLGLSPWQVRNIYRYRAKGGIYRSARDFSRLYGLTRGQYAKMQPYIHISDEYQPLSVSSHTTIVRDSLKYPIKIKPAERIILNQAYTFMLKSVPGIGSGYARAIINYGNRLGGYYDVNQLREIADFPLESIKYFIIQGPSLKKLNVNKLTINQLRRHPYINFYQAKAIVDYHRLHGPLQSIQQLRLMKEFPEEAIRRLEPYLEY